MYHIIMALFLLISLQGTCDGYTLSMEEAEKLLIENNLELRVKKADLKKNDAEVIEAKIFTNPEASYNLESVKNGAKEREETYSLSQRMPVVGQRSKKIETALKKRDARTLFYEHEKAGLLAQMKQSYYRALLLLENMKAMESIIEMLRDVEGKTEERFKAGDVSEAELMRVMAERKKVLRSLEGLKAETTVEKKKLALMLNLPEDTFDLRDDFRYRASSLQKKDLVGRALEDRADVRAQAALLEASESFLSLSRREAVPQVAIEAGYKRRTGGFEGFVFGLSIPLPVFDRNQGNIALAQAELEQERLNYELLKKNAEYEVNLLYEKLTSLKARVSDITGQLDTTKELTKISLIAYEEGEAGLIELLDAVRTEKELLMEYNTLVYEHRAAVFEMEKAAGTKLADNGGTR